jgi:single-strand DNA-binding protein
MLGINSTHYIGSVASQPDMKYTPGGLAILELTVAGRSDILTAEGEVKRPAFYNRCKCFGKYAESLAESLQQGDVVSVHGRLEYRSYEVEGEKRSTVETVIDTIQTLEGRFITEDDKRGQPVLVGGLNSVTIGGNLTRDPDHRQLPTGNSVTRVSVAVNERYTGKDGDGEKVGYFDLQAWGELAEALAEGAKGSGIIGVGRLVNESWDDPHGNKRYGTKVELERAHFISSGPGKSSPAAKPKQAAKQEGNAPINLEEEFPPEQNLPF